MITVGEARVLACIEKSFDAVRLDGGESIHVAFGEGMLSSLEAEYAMAQDQEVHWREVPDWKLESLSLVLSTLDHRTLRFYMPAYLCWAIRCWRSTDSPAIDNLIQFLTIRGSAKDQQFKTLTPEQKICVNTFLNYLANNSVDLRPECVEALASYWDQFSIRDQK